MKTKIIQIMKDDMDELMKLFVLCFKDDSFYKKLFPNTASRGKYIEKRFFNSINYCVISNGAYGVKENDQLIAFVLYFNYQETKKCNISIFNEIFKGKNSKQPLPYEKEIHDKTSQLGENVIYLLSVGVHKDYRRKGIAGSLIDFVLENNSSEYVVGDVSNSDSLPIYRKRDFVIDRIDDNYYLIKHNLTVNLSELCFDEGEINLALADKDIITELGLEESTKTPKIELSGYCIVTDHLQKCFIKSPFNKCEAYVVSISYQQLLKYQRYINLSNYNEGLIFNQSEKKILIYYQNTRYSNDPLWNDDLRSMIETRREEWNIIPDIQILIPVEYTNEQKIINNSANFNQSIDTFLRFLDYRTHYEAGVPKGSDELDSFSFKNRIKRYNLGKLKVKITKESTVDTYDSIGDEIGAPAYVDIFISIDKSTNCGVFTIVSLSTPFLISHFMDDIIRNQLFIQQDDDSWVNLYEFLENKFGVNKRGTAKLYLTISQKKDYISTNHIASLLMSETIYNSNEDFGRLTDEEILNITDSKNGMGQYDRAFVCVYTNVFIQFCEHLQASVKARLNEESITFFYIELLAFEESAIQIAEYNITATLSESNSISTIKFLKKTLRIQREFAKTIEFWDIQVNYPSSKKSVSMIRKAFRIDEHITRMNRESEQLQSVFNTKRDIKDRIEASILTYIMLSLTLIQLVSVFAPSFFNGNEIISSNKSIGLLIIITMIFIYSLLKKIMSKSD